MADFTIEIWALVVCTIAIITYSLTFIYMVRLKHKGALNVLSQSADNSFQNYVTSAAEDVTVRKLETEEILPVETETSVNAEEKESVTRDPYENVKFLAESGLNAKKIATKVGMPMGEIETILKFKRFEDRVMAAR